LTTKIVKIVFVLLALVFPVTLAQKYSGDEVKTAFLEKFSRFVEWQFKCFFVKIPTT